MEVEVLDTQHSHWKPILAQLPHDVYHLPEYLELEAERIHAQPYALLVREQNKVFFLPFLKRQCNPLFPQVSFNTEIYDAVSPYGYPGILLSPEAVLDPNFVYLALEAISQHFASQNICSLFVRNHPILSVGFSECFPQDSLVVSGDTISIDLTLNHEEYWSNLRRDHRLRIKQGQKLGCTVKFVCPSDPKYMKDFIQIYHETMARVGAAPMYFFDSHYFNKLAQIKDCVHLALVEFEDQIVCAGLFFETCKIVQLHLSGTRNSSLKFSPSVVLIDGAYTWAKQRDNKWLHLGGGVGAKHDSLYQFKVGFSKQQHLFSTMRLITHPEHYHRLVKCRQTFVDQPFNPEFFPAYR